MARRSTSTSAFGVSKREGHDASGFYRRFTPPELSADAEVHPGQALDKLILGDARSMTEVDDSSVALVVTSPPYFAGKEYEEALGQGGVPGSYLEYLGLLREVFAECVRKLEPGGRIAVNVANLGRRPYRSLSADVTGILQDDLRLLLRGEIIWLKQRGSSGSCAWGSFQRPGNPVLRDLTERVIVASKGRFDRAVPARDRQRRQLPSEASMTREDFMENTLDVWEIAPESATRVGHPAPFPIELPARLIDLYTYRGDLVLDPFLGSGTTAVAAVRAERHYVGYDLDGSYLQLAEERVARERQRGASRVRVSVPAVAATSQEDAPHARAVSEGRAAKDIARVAMAAAGFTDITSDERLPGGLVVDFAARDRRGGVWHFDVVGSFTSHRSGLRRTETLWRALGKAAVLRQVSSAPLVLLTTDGPAPGSAGAEALKQMVGPRKPIRAVIDIVDASAPARLHELGKGVRQR
ncbi:MAG TPA: site-specific DNA-methyltransferase [Acidimicrobiales bacterium]